MNMSMPFYRYQLNAYRVVGYFGLQDLSSRFPKILNCDGTLAFTWKICATLHVFDIYCARKSDHTAQFAR